MKKTRCEYTGWMVAWILMILLVLVFIDDIRLSRIVVNCENKIKELENER